MMTDDFLRPVRRGLTGVALMCFFLAAGAASGWSAENNARLTYTRVLKGSVPEYLSISVDSQGKASYEGRKLDEPPAPHPFQLSMATTQQLFSLAEALNNFQGIDLESHKRVANLGLKTLVYERDGRRNQVEFNYTQQHEAQLLAGLFERIASVEQHILTLEHAMKYDHLSLPRELLQIQIDLDKRALADPELLVPSLEKIAKNPRFLHLAQARAQTILQRLQNTNLGIARRP
jgi:hypothetical protein